MKEACSERHADVGNGYTSLTCRRFPPIYYQSSGYFWVGQVPTNDDTWCGEYVENPNDSLPLSPTLLQQSSNQQSGDDKENDKLKI